MNTGKLFIQIVAIFFLNHYYNRFLSVCISSTIGAVIVLGGVLTIAFRKWLRALPEDNSTRQTWSFLLR